MSNKKILFNVEVNQNLNEKSLVNKKLLSSKVNTSLSTLSNPISPMSIFDINLRFTEPPC